MPRELLWRVDEALGSIDRLAGCFTGYRRAELVAHIVRALIGQRVFGIALI
jgi:hypothetical protein